MVQWEGGNDEKVGDSYSTLKLFQNPYSLLVYHQFLEYILNKKKKELVEGSVLSLVQLEARIVGVVDCFLERETRRGHGQERYVDTMEGT